MIYANHSGIAEGQFTIPEGIPAGTKTVTFIGERGTRSDTEFTGRGEVTIDERRRIVTVTRYDPLAQTFTLAEARHVSALDLWFIERGDKPLTVQIRETTVGIPNQTVLARTTIPADAIKTDGTETRITFPVPVFLDANREYAIVILTDDNTHALRIAEIGQYDRDAGKYVTEQGYAVGVLLSSSNASTWTPHNNADLAFRLYAAKFTETTHTVPLNNVAASNVSDLYAMADVERTGNETDVRFTVADGDDTQWHLQDGQAVRLAARESGDLTVKATLTGSAKRSPVLYPGIFMALGDLQETATYISRAIPAGKKDAIVTLETLATGSASVQVEIGVDDNWHVCSPEDGEPVGDGWVRASYKHTVGNGSLVRCRLTLRGNIKDRPQARALRMVTT